MANNILISYDLHQPGRNYDKVADAIKSLGSWAKVQYSYWYVSSNLTASDAAKKVWEAMDINDSLIVIDATNNNASWYNLKDNVSKYLQTNWYK